MGWLATAIALGPTPAEDGVARCEALLVQVKGHRAVEAHVRGAEAVLTAMLGRFAEARDLYRTSREIYGQLGLVHWEAGRTVNRGLVELMAGSPDAAARELSWGLGTLEAMGERNISSTVAAVLAYALAVDGQHDEAVRIAEKSEDATAPGDVVNEIFCPRARARVLAAQGSTEQAEELLRGALTRVETTDMLSVHGDTLLDLAHILGAAGRSGEVGEVLDDALALYEHKGNVAMAERARRLLEELRVGSEREGRPRSSVTTEPPGPDPRG